MADALYDRINDYSSVRVSLASPDDIRGWSYGEVKKPETINYRTYRAEKDGLFCERIFGPERDWECFCGKYKGMKHKGIVCDRCGVKVTHSRVRRRRMGHINLAAPIVHIWFFKAMPSRLGTLLGMKTTQLERVIYYQDYVVVDPGDTPLKDKQLLTEEEYRECIDTYGESAFRADMGAEAVRAMLSRLDLNETAKDLREELKETKAKQRTKEIIKRLDLVEKIRNSCNETAWMVMDVIPVIPPDLRPLVLLESGNCATSDLNDLYRRIINRNNRLKKLLDLHAPEVIIRNEKRMLQQAVDALFDNNRCKRPVLGSSNRPLKSLTDMIKGKQGRFRENLLGKRVDYSARSVIVVGPELKLHQCGLPKKIALELFQPFIIRRLKDLDLADTIKSAKKMLERKDPQVWDILEQVIRNHPVLLNRAPTLHRMGIQAFEPLLIEGNAIKIHPLVCRGFNADFDGDQMAVHLPLSIEAQIEASTLMMATNNIFSPASGDPIVTPSQDIVLGAYYLTVERPGQRGEGMVFGSSQEVFMAYDNGKLSTHASIKLRLPKGKKVVDDRDGETLAENGLCQTAVGRVVFNDILPDEMPFYNKVLQSKGLSAVIRDCHKLLGREATISLLDSIKETGFKHSTLAGISFAAVDLVMPSKKQKLIDEAQNKVDKIEKHYERGVITDAERHNQVIDVWMQCTEHVSDEMMIELAADERDGKPYLNPVFIMTDSGARGSQQQIRQLAGMRGLMAKPDGSIIETPIKSNFREGLHVLEYFSSTHGARKGLADTALKTADSGYLTRKLADVAQNVVVSMIDCGTLQGITKGAIYLGEEAVVTLARTIYGRVARDTITNPVTDEVIVKENELITEEVAAKVEALGLEKIRVRSVLTCEAEHGVCAKCYGMDLSRGELIELGMAAGIIAAQSIGEPGTQLTMRTFHIGGTAARAIQESTASSRHAGIVRYHNLKVVQNQEKQNVTISRTGEIIIDDDKGREIDRCSVPLGSVVFVPDGGKVKQGGKLCEWDPHMTPIIAEGKGIIKFQDIIEGKTMAVERDEQTGHARKTIVEHKGDLQPQIQIVDAAGEMVTWHPIPEKAFIEVEEGQKISAGTILARTPREVGRTQDITGGLPRVTEIFEARKPKDPAVMSEIEGVVEIGERRRGKQTIIVRGEQDMEREHLVPQGKHPRVHRGDYVRAGEQIVDGPLVLQDILRINGDEELQQYMLREVQNVYLSQNVRIDDKHIEVIISQMMRKVNIETMGDTELLPGTIIDRLRFRRINQEVVEKGGQPATASPVLMGITKAALQSDSFISAASFQETTKVLTEAALAGKQDMLLGLKENVILGHLVPAGTGFHANHESLVKVKELPEGEAMEETEEAEAATED